MTIDVPSGRVVARVRRARRRGRGRVAFRNVPSFVVARGVAAAGVEVDVAYGGAHLRLRRRPRASACASCRSDLPRLIAAGRAVKRDARRDARSRAIPTTSGCRASTARSCTRSSGRCTSATSTVFADGEVDRSPCGSGTSARCALLAADGALGRGDVLRHDSIVGTTFRARVVGEGAERRAHRGRGHGVPHRRAPLRARPARPARHGVRAAVSAAVPRRRRGRGALRSAEAADALEAALRAGLDPEADPPRGVVPARAAASCS